MISKKSRLGGVAVFVCALVGAPAFAASPDLVISQVYGGGGNSGATLKNDFIEIFNRGTTAVSLSGKSVQYASTTGSFTQLTLLSGSLNPGQYYLVQEAPGTGGTVSLPTPDASGSIAMSATGGKVALVNSTSTLNCGISTSPCSTAQLALIIDLVGYDGATLFETAATPALTNTTAALRNSGGCVDTDNNSSDFSVGTPSPRNTSSSTHDCQAPTGLTVASASASPASVSAGDSTTLSVSVSPGAHPDSTGIAVSADLSSIGGGSSASFADNGNGSFSFAATVSASTAAGTKTIPVTATDAQSRSATGSITLTVTAAVPHVAIHDIQGTGEFSPYGNQLVQTEGIVTARSFNGYFIQAPESEYDGDSNTPEGIFVFTGGTGGANIPAVATIGSRLRIRATVHDFIPASDPGSPAVTELSGAVSVTQLSTGNQLPTAIVLSRGDYDPNGAFSQLRKYEGMRVYLPGPITVVAPSGRITLDEVHATATSNGSFYGVLPGVPRPFREPGIEAPAVAPAGIPQFDGNPERVRVNTGDWLGSTPINVATGDVVANIIGVMDFTFRSYSILTDPATPPSVTYNNTGFTAVRPGSGEGEITVAAANLERFFDTVDDPSTSDAVLTAAALNLRLTKASMEIRNVLRTPDVVAIEEMENPLPTPTMNGQSTLTTPTSGSVILQLAQKIDDDATAAGQTPPHYQAYETYSNDIGGIASALLVKPSRIEAVKVEVIDTDPCTGHRPWIWRQPIELDCRNLSTTLLNDRPPLVLHANVIPVGKELPYSATIIVNHLRSLSGIDDPVDGPRVQAKREAQAEFLASLIDSYQQNGEKVISVGDYNAFDVNDGFADVINVVRGGTPHPSEDIVPGPVPALVQPELIDLSAADPAQRYSFMFDGNAQLIDHIIVSQSLKVNDFMYGRVNADFPESLRGDITRPERVSDHDPVIAYFGIPRDTVPPVVTLSGPIDGAFYNPSAVPGATCTTADDASGVKTPAHLVTSGGPTGSVTVTCTGAVDNVGNAAADVSVTYFVDATPPVVTLSGPVSGAFYRPATVPAATCATTDADSGVRTPAHLVVAGGPTGAVTATCTGAVDNVGNVGADVSVTYFVDATPPVVTLSGPVEGAFYRPDNAPAASCATTDAESGVQTPAHLVTSGGPTGPVTVTCTGAVDNAGNVAADVSVHYVVDGTPPVVTLSGPVEGAFYSLFDVPAATCTTTDASSGVRTPATLVLSGGPAGPVTATCTGAIDNAGNIAADVSVHYFVDATPPVVTLRGPVNGATYLLGTVPAASCDTTDADSGVATPAHLTITGGPVGDVTATCSGAVDKVGNTGNLVAVHYKVVAYTFVGFAAPLSGSSTTVKGGSTVPVKFQIFDWNGALVTDPAVVSRIELAPRAACAASSDDAWTDATPTGNTSLRFDGTQFVFNWKTTGLAAGCYSIAVSTVDTLTHATGVVIR